MRVKTSVTWRRKRKKILKSAKGYRGALSRRYRLAKQMYYRSGAFAFRGRKEKKRNFRRLWITRINIAARNAGLKYSDLIHGLKLAGVNINRKMLAELAVHDVEAFNAYVEVAKEALSRK